MARERILAEHEIEGRVEPLRRDLPRAERAAREARREQRLADAANRSGASIAAMRSMTVSTGNAAACRDLAERIGLKTGKAILGDREDRRVDGIGYRRRRR